METLVHSGSEVTNQKEAVPCMQSSTTREHIHRSFVTVQILNTFSFVSHSVSPAVSTSAADTSTDNAGHTHITEKKKLFIPRTTSNLCSSPTPLVHQLVEA